MELRVLKYFLAVAREQNISRAAEYLHLTQPTLSRQLKDLETEFGKQLLIRGKRKVTLTDDGAVFRKMAEEIVSLANRAENEMKNPSQTIAGDIYIGTGESNAVRNIIHVAGNIQKKYPGVHFHVTSGDTADLIDRLDKGLFNFCILYGVIDQSKYEFLELPYREKWGVLMRCDAELAEKEIIETSDLWDKSLIVSRQVLTAPSFFKWIGKTKDQLNITNTYNLIYNAKLMAEAGMGYVITLEKLVNTKGTPLCLKPIHPESTLKLYIVWKKYQVQSRAARQFIEDLTKHINTNTPNYS